MKKKDIFWGIFFILAAVLVIVNQLGFLPKIGIFEIVATVVLVAIIVKCLIHFWFPGMLFPIAFLCIIYAEEWHITQLTPWPVLATAFLGSIGLGIIFKKNKFNYYDHYFHKEHVEEVINEPDGSVINCFANFGSSMKYVNSDHFERANIKCSFGGMKVYFDNAVIADGTAEIYLDVSFSGVELYIPKGWKVIDEVNASFGAMEMKNRGENSDSPIVTIKGSVSFGGVEIIYV
mgnify:FL=1